MEKITLKLKSPIAFGESQITELIFDKPKAKHFKRMKLNPDMGDLLEVAARLCNQHGAIIDELSPEDMMEVISLVGKCFENSQ